MTADLEKLVKPLVWDGMACISDSRYDVSYWQREKLFVDAYTTMRRHDTFEAAKAAAQADYEARIAAALAPDAVAKMVQDAVQAELEACAQMIEDAVCEGRRDLAAAGKRPSTSDEMAVKLLKAFAAAIRARGDKCA